MTPDPDDAAAPPPEPASVPAALSSLEHRAVEAAVAGAAALLIGRVLLGRAGGLATGLVALGAGLLGKCPTPRPKTRATEPGGSNGSTGAAGTNGGTAHSPAPELGPQMRVRLQTSPVPPLDVIAAFPAAEALMRGNFAPVAVQAPEIPEAPVEDPAAEISPAHEDEDTAAVATAESMIAAEPELEAPAEVFAREPAADVEDAGAFAEMPALFEPVEPPVESIPVAISPLPPALEPEPPPPSLTTLATLLKRAETELESLPVPGTGPVPPFSKATPSSKSTPVRGLLEDLPVEFAELKEEQEPGPREDFLILPEETPKALPALEPVVAALSMPRSLFDEAPPPSEETPAAAAAASPFLIDSVPDMAPVDRAADEVAAVPAAIPTRLTAPVQLGPFESAGDPEPAAPPAMLKPEPVPVSPLEPPPWAAPVFGEMVTKPEAEEVPPFPAAASLLTMAVPAPVPGSVAPAAPETVAAPITTPVLEPGPAAFPTEAPTLPWQLDPGLTAPIPPLEDLGWKAPLHAPEDPMAPPGEPADESPFLLAPAPAGRPPGPSLKTGPTPDPEEIWRQAAAELSELHDTGPTPPAVPFPPPVAAPSPSPTTPVPPLTAPFPEAVPAPSTGAVPATGLPAELPPWLKEIQPLEPPPEEGKASDSKPYLPTIRLAVPQGPQPMAARRPIPLSDTPSLETTAVRPIPLPGYRAESLPDDADDAPLTPLETQMAADPLPGLDSPIPPLTPPPALVPLPEPVPAPIAAMPVLAPTPESLIKPPGGEEDKVFVDRRKSRHAPVPPPAKGGLTPMRVIMVGLLALSALTLAFKDRLVPWLQAVWEQRIQGKLPPRKPPAPPTPEPTTPVGGVPGDGSDVIIAPEPEKAPAPPAKKPDSPPADPPTAEPPAAPPPKRTPEGSAPVVVPAPDSEPPAENANTPLPATQEGATELISRLLYATSPRQVRPYILDSEKAAPALEAYFTAGRWVPVSSHLCELDNSEKIPGTSRMMWQFRVTTDTIAGGFPVLVEETADGLRADWELLTQCRDMALQKWMAKLDAPAGNFYTGLQRRHPFPDMLPGKDHTQYLAFAVGSPILGEQASYAFIPKDTPLGTRAASLYNFGGATSAPVLELTHKDGHVEITGIVRENWRTPVVKK